MPPTHGHPTIGAIAEVSESPANDLERAVFGSLATGGRGALLTVL